MLALVTGKPTIKILLFFSVGAHVNLVTVTLESLEYCAVTMANVKIAVVGQKLAPDQQLPTS